PDVAIEEGAVTRTVQLAGAEQDGAPEVRADGVDRRNRIWPAFQGAGDEQRAGESGRTAGDDASHCRQGGKVRDRKAELPVADAEILQEIGRASCRERV